MSKSKRPKTIKPKKAKAAKLGQSDALKRKKQTRTEEGTTSTGRPQKKLRIAAQEDQACEVEGGKRSSGLKKRKKKSWKGIARE